MIVARAASHVLFALLGAWYLRYRPNILSSFFKTQIFSFIIGIIHAWAEVTVVSFFYLNGGMAGTYYSAVTTILLLVGLGSLVHSMVDFVIALAVLKPLMARESLRPLFVISKSS
ncbi:hypothetical protein FACS1894216_12500 [Synergistales bacterium]|nr:hypothetical protein FACS1894216_12500 [Synergistales bacterium]